MSTALERFQRDVADHAMEVLHEDGVYRHLRFSNGGSSAYHFNITTWPGYLCISGDMGCYVFSRLQDMFAFFRDERVTMGINPGYWQEKIQAGAGIARRDLTKDWSAERFREHITDHFDNYVESQGEDLSDEAKAELWEAIDEEVLYHEEDEHGAMRAAMDFKHGDGHYSFEFVDFFECDCTEWSFHYLWCCYAIVWGISQYEQQHHGAAA